MLINSDAYCAALINTPYGPRRDRLGDPRELTAPGMGVQIRHETAARPVGAMRSPVTTPTERTEAAPVSSV